MGAFIDLTGQRFGRLTVIERAENKGKCVMWKCLCDCGNYTITNSYSLRSCATKSCGCLNSELAKQRKQKHKHCEERIYHIWKNMKQRCSNANFNAYTRYGGRGITVCDEWLNDFQAFYDWAMANGYKDGLTIDRINNNKGYSPDNCRWATPKEQANNRQSNHLVTFNGKTQTIAQWADELNMNYFALYSKLKRLNYI